jgi:phage/plasmid primase-like uncharacterized protein/phage/plasmid-associated DNA primase
MSSDLQAFADAMRAAGIEPPANLIADGCLHRFSTNGRNNDSAGWYIVHVDQIPVGVFGDWRSGVSGKWAGNGRQKLSPEERREQAKRIRAAKRNAEKERKRQHAEAAAEASRIWEAAEPAADSHPYLERKQIRAHGVRIAKDGRLIVPVRIASKLASLQFIAPDGTKRFLPSGATAGGYCGVGNPEGAKRLLIAEGFATCATLFEATKLPAVAAFSAHNLLSVARAMKKQFPDATLVICADDDYRTEGNPGLKGARVAAAAVGGLLTVPTFDEERPEGASDFNDLARMLGLETVRQQIETAEHVHESSKPTAGSTELLRSRFLDAPSHGLAADILYAELNSQIIYEPYNERSGQFYSREPGMCYFGPVIDIKARARCVLETAIGEIFNLRRQKTDDIKDLFQKAGKAFQKARTRDFLASAIALFAERVTVIDLRWNATPEAHATLTGIIDFSGDTIKIRDPLPGEYFKDPIPEKAEDIKEGGSAPAFDRFLADLFPDGETKQSALHCLGLAVANRPSKIFQVWHNAEGNAAKNTLADLVIQLLPTRAVWASGAIIGWKPDQGERRFGTSVLQGCTAVFLDEVGAFDIGAIKRLTSLSPIRVEQKGRDSFDILPTWALIALCNEFPPFFPADDQGFLSRLFILVFQTVFYTDKEDRERYIKHGVAEKRLKPDREKTEILAELLPERAAILHRLIAEYKGMRAGNGRPYESAACRQAKDSYRSANDIVERFFDEYLERDDGGRVELARLAELYAEYVGNKKTATRTLTTELKKRFRFLDTKCLHGKRYLLGARERDGGLL